jgi:hypothetical protein
MNSDLYRYKLNKYKNRYRVLFAGGEQHSDSDDDYDTADEPDFPLAEIIRGTSQTISLSLDPSTKVGIMIAGNAGRPGGLTGRMDGTGIDNIEALSQHFMDNRYRTIEESVVASWMAAEYFNPSSDNLHNIFRRTLGDEFKTNPKYGSDLNDVGQIAVDRPWGMLEISSTNPETIQGIDFTLVLDPELYKFAYSLRDVPIIDNTITRIPGCSGLSVRKVDLVFVYGPNVGFTGKTRTGSGQRTLVSSYQEPGEYNIFKQAIMVAIRTGLEKMITDGVTVALVARVSCGIYAGRRGSYTRNRINQEFTDIVNYILSMEYPPNRNIIGDNFQRVIIPLV